VRPSAKRTGTGAAVRGNGQCRAATSSTLSVIVLAHLSQLCNRPDVARVTVERHLRARGFRGMLTVALQDAPLPPIVVRPNPASLQVELDFLTRN